MKWYILMGIERGRAGVWKAPKVRHHNFSKVSVSPWPLDKCTGSHNSPQFVPYSPPNLLKCTYSWDSFKLFYIFYFHFTFSFRKLKKKKKNTKKHWNKTIRSTKLEIWLVHFCLALSVSNSQGWWLGLLQRLVIILSSHCHSSQSWDAAAQSVWRPERWMKTSGNYSSIYCQNGGKGWEEEVV